MGQFLDLLEAEPLDDHHTRNASLEARVSVLEDEMGQARHLLKRLLPLLEQYVGGSQPTHKPEDMSWRLM